MMPLNSDFRFDLIVCFIHSGLDDLSCSQCVALLRRIARGGRTVICSIHTPSAKIFEMFDHVYTLAYGQCAYQGPGSNLISYMQSIGLSCPLTYNPADFSTYTSWHDSTEYAVYNNYTLIFDSLNRYCFRKISQLRV